MKKIAIISFLLCIFAALSAQEPASLPSYPEFSYISTLQVSEDEYGIANDYDYIMVTVTKNGVQLQNDHWDDFQKIESWELTPVRQNSNNNWIYKWEGYSPTACAYYSIPTVYFPKEKRWSCGYLTEKLCVGVDYTTYRNNTPVLHKIQSHVQDSAQQIRVRRLDESRGKLD